MMKSHSWAWIILILAIILSAVIRISGALGKKTLTYDESISFCAASAHLSKWSDCTDKKIHPYGEWVKTAEWKQLLVVDDKFCFKKIATGVAEFDGHPPLYFWMLHIWSILVGVNVLTGPSLNLFFSIFTMVFLYNLANTIWQNRIKAALVSCIWALSPAVIRTSFEARQYELLSLITITLVWLVFQTLYKANGLNFKNAIFLAIAVAAGALTHYYFAIVVLGIFLYLTLRLINKNLKLLLQYMLIMISGYILFYILHPRFYLAYTRYESITTPFQFQQLFPKLITSFFALLEFVTYMHIFFDSVKYLLILCVFGFLIVVFIPLKSRWKTDKFYSFSQILPDPTFYMFFLFIFITSAWIFLYVVSISPEHSIGGKYFCMTWLFVPFLIVSFIYSFDKWKRMFSILVCTGLLLSSILNVGLETHVNNKLSGPLNVLKNAKNIVISNTEKGLLGPILWQTSDSTQIYVAEKSDLLKDNSWINYLEPSNIYINSTYHDKDLIAQQRITDLISRSFKYDLLSIDLRGKKYTYLVLK